MKESIFTCSTDLLKHMNKFLPKFPPLHLNTTPEINKLLKSVLDL